MWKPKPLAEHEPISTQPEVTSSLLPGTEVSDLRHVIYLGDSEEADECYARHYDDIYTNGISVHDHAKEAQLLKELVTPHLSRTSLRGCRVLDVGCGTGDTLQEFKLMGAEGLGIDVNPHLLQVARTKYPTLDFQEADMRSFEVSDEYDLATCLFDPLCFCDNQEELNETFGRIGLALRPGGVAALQQKKPGPDSGCYHQRKTFDGYELAKYTESFNVPGSDPLTRYLDHWVSVQYFNPDGPDRQYVFRQLRKLTIFALSHFEEAATAAGLEIVDYVKTDEMPPLRRDTFVLKKPE
ncbi:MAG TPA: class I SAM-dependent methyltransferase [Candidatus Saccharimonadales bacterium]|nr:class I SAM-dependent methyltransferase [Candidatus Saccharimonadales bacterium]